jgi:hypothetical protein
LRRWAATVRFLLAGATNLRVGIAAIFRSFAC